MASVWYLKKSEDFFFLKKVLYFLMTSLGGFQNPSVFTV